MACFFATPCTMHFANYRPAANARNRASFVPLALVFFVLFVAPVVLRIALVFLMTAVNLFFTLAPAMCVMCALTASLCGAEERVSRESFSAEVSSADRCCGIRKAFRKMKAAKEACRSEAKVTTAKTKSDLSSGSAVERADGGLLVTIAAPGVKQSDIKVTVVDQTLSIRGETRRGAEVFEVNRGITVPSIYDVGSAACTHADGVLSINLNRKESKTIQVNVQNATGPEAQPEAGLPVEAEDAAAQDSEGEWVESAPPTVKKDQ